MGRRFIEPFEQLVRTHLRRACIFDPCQPSPVVDLDVMARWQKLALIGAAACGLLVGLAWMLGKFSRGWLSAAEATPWNSKAIGATLAGIQVKEVDSAHAAVVFFYDLDNKTDRDYRLANGPGVVIMSRLRSNSSLVSNDQTSPSSAAFVPARDRTRIALAVARPFDWPAHRDAVAEGEFRQLAASQVAGLAGFVLFDQADRYQIELPAASANDEQVPVTPQEE